LEVRRDEELARQMELARLRAMEVPTLEDLKRDMADAHPDRGGSAAKFIDARSRYLARKGRK
jgi:hypothetical protein